MSNLLLDSNALISYVANAKRIGAHARKLLNKSQLFYSPLSLFELKMKELRIPGFHSNLNEKLLESLGFNPLNLEPKDLQGMVLINAKDPFDLMLVSQAKARGLGFVTADLEILESGLDFCIDLTV